MVLRLKNIVMLTHLGSFLSLPPIYIYIYIYAVCVCVCVCVCVRQSDDVSVSANMNFYVPACINQELHIYIYVRSWIKNTDFISKMN